MPGLPKLKHANGAEVTAQEAYDAFRNTRVLIVMGIATYEATSMVWYDNNSAQDDPTNVGYVKLSYVTKVDSVVVVNETGAGDLSLVPARQG